MLTAWYPFKEAKNIIQAMSSVPKMPDYINKWQTFAAADGKEGVKVYNLIMVKEGKSDEASIYLTKNQNVFIEKIEGYRWKIEPVMGMKDSLKVFGG
ncbi:MAG: hypothetical protein EU516_01240 [Promethearchaeota archaeon]|jgi:hypothetical protein|nr:MAG: hypothetical protein EU516_01240 [Candidatus Lokiarchaeota archaeon]